MFCHGKTVAPSQTQTIIQAMDILETISSYGQTELIHNTYIGKRGKQIYHGQ